MNAGLRQHAPMTPGVDAAVEIAEDYGLQGAEPAVLQDTNNTVVWLKPHPVVAKVATGKQTQPSVVREHDVCRHLAGCGAPIRGPWSDAPIRRHERTGFIVSLWDFLEDAGDELSTSATAETLQEVHRALATYPGPLPSFRDALAAAAQTLGDDQRMRALPVADLAMLRAGFAALLDKLEGHPLTDQPLHGEPHLGNVLSTPFGPRWIDFEAVSNGPLEWDLAFLTDDAVATFPIVDQRLLALLRPLNSARVATWCWARVDLPGMRAHAEHHLDVVRRAIG
jgi:Ser/Thr protein kinase RdoA (MazF antagonist)